MKNKFSILLVLLILANPFYTQAMQILEQNSKLSYFSQLILKFNNAKSIIDISEILGWNAGRCYRYDETQKPYGEILIGMYTDDNNGPMFPSHDLKFIIAPRLEDALPANRYDNLGKDDESMISNAVNEAISNIRMDKKNGEWESSYMENLFQVRKLDSYYIGLGKINFDVDHIKYPWFPLNKGDVWISCYFFKKLK